MNKKRKKEKTSSLSRVDGRSFSFAPETPTASPLDVPAVSSRLKKGELVAIIREGRERR
jgi:hypothetical protein